MRHNELQLNVNPNIDFLGQPINAFHFVRHVAAGFLSAITFSSSSKKVSIQPLKPFNIVFSFFDEKYFRCHSYCYFNSKIIFQFLIRFFLYLTGWTDVRKNVLANDVIDLKDDFGNFLSETKTIFTLLLFRYKSF